LFYENIIITELVEELGLNWYVFAKAGHQVSAISRNILKALLSNENISLSVDLSNESELNKVNEFPSLGNKLMQLSIMREVYC
jgi:hypothetical protein